MFMTIDVGIPPSLLFFTPDQQIFLLSLHDSAIAFRHGTNFLFFLYQTMIFITHPNFQVLPHAAESQNVIKANKSNLSPPNPLPFPPN